MKVYIILLFTLLMNLDAEAKSFDRGKSTGHEADAYSVLPFEKSTEISDWFEIVHKTIDYPYNSYFEGIHNPPHQNFTWGKYGHRLFFHWGFNGKPWSPQIQEMVDRCRWDEQTVILFRLKLINEQSRRNLKVMTVTNEMLHFGMSGQMREYSNGFASILYDTHLLGDYSTTKIAPLQELNLVIDDIKVTLYRKLKGGDEALRINKLLDNTGKLYPDQKIRAVKVLDILQKELPRMILNAQNGYFKRHFKEMGLKLKTLS